jgi:hypothetical protein
LFCAWLAWSRFRVVLAIRDKTSPSVMAALDVTLRRLAGKLPLALAWAGSWAPPSSANTGRGIRSHLRTHP